MPRFFFDIVQNDDVTVDREGHDFVDYRQAHLEALKAIGSIAAEEILKDSELNLTISVTDETRHVLFRKYVRFEPGSRVAKAR